VTVAHTHFEIHSEREADTGRLRLLGELDLASVAGVEQAVDAALAQGVRTLTLELSGLSFVDSSGLRLFIVLSQRAATEGWKLSMTRPQEQAMTVFRVSGLVENLPFAEGASKA
jgi:anti-sigma B factor antagonist